MHRPLSTLTKAGVLLSYAGKETEHISPMREYANYLFVEAPAEIIAASISECPNFLAHSRADSKEEPFTIKDRIHSLGKCFLQSPLFQHQ